MRVAEASQHAKRFQEDDGLSLPTLKPQWLKEQRPNGGISNQFRSADQFRGRGGRKFTDDRRIRRPGEGVPKTTSPAPSSDFPPLPPFYRSHSTGSLTPADVPSASSRLLSSKDEKPFSINRECDFPTLATAAAVVEQPARMNKSKSATALPQAISPSSDLLKAHYPTLAALAGPAATLSPMPSTPAVSPDPPPAIAGKQTHKKKPSFSEKVSFSEIAAAEQKATSNRDKFQRAMADSRELQRFRSLVPSKPVHPSLAINARPALRPSRPKPSASVLKAPSEMMPSPATMRKATSAPVLPMSTLPRSPPNPSPLAAVCNSAQSASSSSSAASSFSSSASSSSGSSSSHRSSSSSSSSSNSSFSPPRPAFMSTSQSARTLPQATLYATAAPAKPQPQQHFPIPRMSFNSSNSSTAPATAASGGGVVPVSPRRRDSSPAAASSLSSSSPLASPRRSLPQAGGDHASLSSSAPLSPRAQSVPSANGGANYQQQQSSAGKASTSSAKKPLRTSGSSSSAKPSSSAAAAAPSSGKPRRGSLLSTGAAAAPHNGAPPRSRSLTEDHAEETNASNASSSSNSSLGYSVTGSNSNNGSRRGSSSSEGNGPSSSSSNSESEDDNSDSEHSDHDEEVMMIATGMTNLAGFYNLRPQIEGVVEEDEDPLQAAAASAKDEFCPFSWEMRADGEEWSEWSEDAVVSFMKKELGYEYPEVNGASKNGETGLSGEDEDEQGLTEEEIRLAKQQIERGANLQQLLEKKKKGLSESLQKKYPAAAAGSVLASSPSSSPVITPSSSFSSSSPSSSSVTSPSLLHQPAVSSSSSSSASSSSRRRQNKPLRSSSGPAGAAHAGGRRQQHPTQHLQHLRQEGVEFDSDSDDSEEGEEVHGFHGIVFG